MNAELMVQQYFEKCLAELEKNPDKPVNLDSWFIQSAHRSDQAEPACIQHHEEETHEEPPRIITNLKEKPVLGTMDWVNPKYWLCGCPIPITQHFSNTQEALQDLFSSSIITFLCQASRIPDFTRFHDHRAHAQSRNDKQGLLIDAKEDYQQFLNYIVELLREIKNHLSQEKINDALITLGAIIHAWQDLAVHQGQSNAEHSYNNRLGKSPDEDIEKSKLAIHISRIFVQDYVLTKLQSALCQSPQVWDTFLHGKADPSWNIYGTMLLGSIRALPGACKFCLQEYRAYEVELNVHNTPLEQLDARWRSFRKSNVSIEDIQKDFFDPIAQRFLQC